MADFREVLAGLPTDVALTFASTKRRDGISDDDFETPPEQVTVVLSFSEKGFGFGEVAIKQTAEGTEDTTETKEVKDHGRLAA